VALVAAGGSSLPCTAKGLEIVSASSVVVTFLAIAREVVGSNWRIPEVIGQLPAAERHFSPCSALAFDP
jgi:hypothetical protein